jgi:hypothetical protein
VPLRAAIYSSTSASPVVELAATDISYGPVSGSVFNFTPPPDAKIEEPAKNDTATAGTAARRARVAPAVRRGARSAGTSRARSAHAADAPKVSSSGHGVSSIAVLEEKAKSGESSTDLPEGLPKVKVNGATATELATELGTLLTFERSGVRYLLVGAVAPAAIETVARGL